MYLYKNVVKKIFANEKRPIIKHYRLLLYKFLIFMIVVSLL